MGLLSSAAHMTLREVNPVVARHEHRSLKGSVRTVEGSIGDWLKILLIPCHEVNAQVEIKRCETNNEISWVTIAPHITL